MDRRLQSAYSRQGSVEVEQQIGERGTVSAGYHYVGGERLLMSINQNVPGCVASGTNNGCRPNPSYANNSQYSAAGTSTYHGLHVSLLHRPARWGQYRVSYTLSKAMNNVGEFFFSSPIDPFDLSKDWGRSDNDQRHRLVVNGTLHTPHGRAAFDIGAPGQRVPGERHAAGVLGAAAEHYLRRHDDSGHRRPADRRWPVHPAQCRRRQRFPERSTCGSAAHFISAAASSSKRSAKSST